MAKIKFHRVAAIAVFLATAAWVATGEFTSVGSAADEAEAARQAEPVEQEAPLRTVGVIDPPRITHARAIRISGITEADKRATLAARSAGIIEELPVRQGDRVEKGDLILKLEAEGREAAVETARQLLDQREAEAEAARRLTEAGNLPPLQLDNALSALAQARSQLEAAEAELKRSRLIAPFSGLIDKVEVELGSSVQQGATVATLLSLDPILVVGEVSERDLRYLKTGDEAEVRLVNGEVLKGKVRYISRDATDATRTFRVEVAIDNPDRVAPAGMTAEITLRAEPVPAVVLPRSVITLSAEGDLGVRGINEDNEVVFYPIDLVDDTPRGLVLGGIPEDVRVIVAGQELTTEGDIVNPVPAEGETIERLTDEVAQGAL